MPSISDFVQDEAVAVILLKTKHGEANVKVRYRPSEITSEKTETFARRDSEGDQLAFLRMICDVIIEWDMEGPLMADVPVYVDGTDTIKIDEDGNEVTERKMIVGHGETIPMDPAILKYMSTPVLGGIWRGVVSDQAAPDPQTSRGSRRR